MPIVLNDSYGTPDDFQKAISELQSTLSREDYVSIESDILRTHGFSEIDYHPASLPTVVVYPRSTEDVVKIVKVANTYKMPVVPYAGASSLEGNFRSPKVGGICVDVSFMNKILEVHEADSDLVCQPGVKWPAVNKHLKDLGIPLFFPLDPWPGATIGGMISTGCSGPNAIRYGTARSEWFLNVTVVLPNGEVIKTRSRARKSAAGFDTTKLFIGGEGTLGIITEVTLRLAPLLDTVIAVGQFPGIREATQAVLEMQRRGVGIQCADLCDDDHLRQVNLHKLTSCKLEEKDSAWFKFQGPTPLVLQESLNVAREVVSKYGGVMVDVDKDEADNLWHARDAAPFKFNTTLEGGRIWTTDACVPASRLPDLIIETKQDVKAHGILSLFLGHLGDGNFHACLAFRNDKEFEVCKGIVYRMNKRAIALEGTCTGEHGIGIGNLQYLEEELGSGTVELMKTIKTALDPHNLFNPGKLYPPAAI